MRYRGLSDSSVLKDEIQILVRAIVIERDGDCVLRKIRWCNDPVLQADHLITRANSATYADTRLIVCLCRSCHGWKHWHKEEYDALVVKVLPKDRVLLWDKMQKLRNTGVPYKADLKLEIIALKKELKTYK